MSQSQLVEKLTLNVIAKTPPDVITLPAPFSQYVINGLLHPIDPYLQQSRKVRRGDYLPPILGTFAANGKQYGLPGIEVGPGLLLIYNQDLFSQAGLPDRGPASLEELYQMHKKLTRQDPNGNKLLQVGLNPLDSMGATCFPDIWSAAFKVDWYDPESTRLRLTDFQPAVEYIKRIYDTPGYGLITGAGIGGWTGGLASGRLAMQINGYWTAGELKSAGAKFPYGYAWMPTGPGDKATAVLPWGLGIPAGVRHPDLSYKLIEFFASPQAAQIMFDAVGWLNGNLPAMRNLNIRDLSVIASIVSMFEQANRVTAPPPVPIMEQIRGRMNGALGAVWRGELPGRTALIDLQRELETRLSEALGTKK